jgi:hypothetical protein
MSLHNEIINEVFVRGKQRLEKYGDGCVLGQNLMAKRKTE